MSGDGGPPCPAKRGAPHESLAGPLPGGRGGRVPAVPGGAHGQRTALPGRAQLYAGELALEAGYAREAEEHLRYALEHGNGLYAKRRAGELLGAVWRRCGQAGARGRLIERYRKEQINEPDLYKSLAAHPLRMRTAFAVWRGLSPIPIRREPGGGRAERQGDTTDDLIEKAREINPHASTREMDMLLSTGGTDFRFAVRRHGD